MNVLDPFEVAFIEVWPLDDLFSGLTRAEKKSMLDRAEYTVFQKVLRESVLGAVLNEKEMAPRDEITLPKSYKQSIVPDSIYRHRKHPDVRIARRATTIANLARVISERDVFDVPSSPRQEGWKDSPPSALTSLALTLTTRKVKTAQIERCTRTRCKRRAGNG